MLVLSRKVGEEIVVGDGVRVVIVGISGRVVRIGVDAPKDVRVLRKELWEANQKGKPLIDVLDCDDVPLGGILGPDLGGEG